jgi:hypothetical protein
MRKRSPACDLVRRKFADLPAVEAKLLAFVPQVARAG